MGICFLFAEAAGGREMVGRGGHGVIRFRVDRCTFAFLLRQAQHERIPPGAERFPLTLRSSKGSGRQSYYLDRQAASECERSEVVESESLCGSSGW